MERSHNSDPQFNQLSGVADAGNGLEGIGPSSRLPELHESMDPEPTKRKGKYNLRTSLAWDTAFFTSAGVLDAEELSTMITGTDEAAKNSLARIEEDITGSTESISSFQSDNLTLDSHEDDLFVDIRASIQRSSKRPPNVVNSIIKMPDTEVLNAVSSPKKEDLALQCKNPKVVSKKVSGLQNVRMSKSQPKQNIGKPGSGKALNQNTVQSQMTQVKSTAKTVPSTSVLRKPPNTIAKTIPNSTATVKRGSIGSAHAKPEGRSLKPALVSSRGGQSPKVHVATGSSKPAGFSKTSSVGSSTLSTMQSARLSASSDSSNSISSKGPTKPPAMTVKRNPVKTSNVATRPVGSLTKLPSQAAVRDRQATSKLSAYMKSTKTSTVVSPASSISEWSSVSSSSSIINPRSHNPRTSYDASSCKSVDSDIIVQDSKNQFANASVDGRKSQEIDVPVNSIRKALAQNGGHQAPMKPSGLRMPSPKIGFFDGVKSNTPKRAPPPQFGLRSSLPKGGAAPCSPKQRSNTKLKSSNVPTATMVPELVNTRLASSKSTVLVSSKKKSHDSPTCSVVYENNATTQNNPKTDQFQFGELNQVIDTCMSDNRENVDYIEIETDPKDMGLEVKNTAALPAGTASGLESIISMGGVGDAFFSENHPANNALRENYQKSVEVGAANQFMDTVSVIEGNLVELQKETEQGNTDVGVMSIDSVVESNSSSLDDISLNMSSLPEGTASGRESITMGEFEHALVSQNFPVNHAMKENYHSAVKVEVGSANQVIDTSMTDIEDSLVEFKKETEPNNSDVVVMKIATEVESNISGAECTGLKGKGVALIRENHQENKAGEVEIGEANQVIDTTLGAARSVGVVGLENDTEVNILGAGITDIDAAVPESSTSELDCTGEDDIEDASVSQKHLENNGTGDNYHKNDVVEVEAETQVIDAVMSAINDTLVELKKEVEQNGVGIGISDIVTVAESSISGSDCVSQEGGDAYLENNTVGEIYHKAGGVEAESQVIDAVMSAINEKLVELKKEIEHNDMSGVVMEIATFAESSASGLECVGQEGDGNASVSQNHMENEADEAEVAANQVMNAVMCAIDNKLADLKKETEQDNLAFGVMDIATVAESNSQGLEFVSPKRDADALLSQNYLHDDSRQTLEGSDKENSHVVYLGEEGVKRYDGNVNPNYCGPMHEVLGEIQDPVASVPVKAYKSSPYQSPFTVKNISGNVEPMSMSKVSDALAEVTRSLGMLSLEKNESC